MIPYKTNEANILYSVRQNNISNNNFQIADTCTHCVPIFTKETISNQQYYEYARNRFVHLSFSSARQ